MKIELNNNYWLSKVTNFNREFMVRIYLKLSKVILATSDNYKNSINFRVLQIRNCWTKPWQLTQDFLNPISYYKNY